jgi:hypothetical protein
VDPHVNPTNYNLSVSPPAAAPIWRAADRTSSWALEGQVTVQSRLGNFLVADSFLLLWCGG